MRPRPRKLLVPFRISTDAWGRRHKGTSAFLPKGEDIPADLRSSLTSEIRQRRTNKRVKGRVAGQVARARQNLAQQSDFFIKTTNARIRLIRQKLLRAGVNIESPIQDLHNNTELFQRGNFHEVYLPNESSPLGYTFRVNNPKRFVTNLRKLIVIMHAQGISHNHMHLRNILASKTGELQLIDLSKARFFERPAKNKAQFLQRFGKDIRLVSLALASLKVSLSRSTPIFDAFFDELDVLLRAHQSRGVQTFGVTPADIIDFHARGGHRF